MQGCNTSDKQTSESVLASFMDLRLAKSIIYESQNLKDLYKSLLERTVEYSDVEVPEIVGEISLSARLRDASLDYANIVANTYHYIHKQQHKNTYFIGPAMFLFFLGLVMIEPNIGQTTSDPTYLGLMTISIVMLSLATAHFSIMTRMPLFIHFVTLMIFGAFFIHNLANEQTIFTAHNLIALGFMLMGLTNLRYVVRYFNNLKHISNARNAIVKIICLN